MQRFMLKISSSQDAQIQNENICCYLVDEKTSAFIPSTDKLVLSYGEKAADVCKNNDLDGVLYELDVKEPIKKQISILREKIGAKKFLGVICPLRRHEVMLAAECEPDFIAFKVWEEAPKVTDIITWYNEFFLIQNALILEDKTNVVDVYDTDFVVLNADFLKEISC